MDEVAWTEFVKVYQPIIRAFVRRQGVAAGDVSDVVQDIFVRLIPVLARFNYDPSRGQFRTWLWRITSNAASNWNRKQASRARTEAAWRERRSAYSVREDAPREQAQARLGHLLDRVLVEIRATTAPATWACFEGRVLRDRPAIEVATEVGVSLNALYVNVSRVRARVREQCVRCPLPVD
jgi:RNA polymerase sigma-70 factor (ECF subfamily)